LRTTLIFSTRKLDGWPHQDKIMIDYFGFRHFRQFERTRQDIRLPYDLLRDGRFRQLADAHKAHLICLLRLAARSGNMLPNRPTKLAYLIGASEPIDVSIFHDFIETASAGNFEHNSAKRDVRELLTDRIRATVIVRDGGRCRRC
jgi:hypothetical protein